MSKIEDSNYQILPIIINSSNLIASVNNNVYRYNFPSGSVKFKKNAKVAVANVDIFYSWFNISSANNNNSITLTFPGIANINITIPNGFYDVEALNSYLQYIMVQNSLYLTNNSTGQLQYFIELVTNPSAYAVQLNSYPMPTSLPTGYTAPSSWPGYFGSQLLTISSSFGGTAGNVLVDLKDGTGGVTVAIGTLTATAACTAILAASASFTNWTLTAPTSTSILFTNATGISVSGNGTLTSTLPLTNPTYTFTLNGATPQLIIPANSNFSNNIGFVAGTYPPVVQSTTYSKLSTYTPEITSIQSVILTCSLLNNRYSVPNTILYSFSSGGSTFGSLISSAPTQFSFVNIQSGDYNYIDITFLDQSFNPLPINDTNLIVQLLISNEIL